LVDFFYFTLEIAQWTDFYRATLC